MEVWAKYLNADGQTFFTKGTGQRDSGYASQVCRHRIAGDVHLLAVRATAPFSCRVSGKPIPRATGWSEDYPLPKLFRIYLRLGAQVLSEPAVDRDFGTIDFLVMLDALGVGLSSLRVVV